MSRTPGPWKWDYLDLWHVGDGYAPLGGNNPHLYTGIKLDERLYKSEVLQANARLIASAPDLADVAHMVLTTATVYTPPELVQAATEALRKAGEI